jgi:DNA polymerase III psi subunit
MKIPEEDKECYLDHSEIARLTGLLSEVSDIKLTSKQLIKKIESLNTKIKKLTTLPNYTENTPFKNLVFEHQLIVLMHFYHKYTSYKMNKNLNKYTINTVSTSEINRYKILNLKKLSERKSCTIELRAKHGSNDATEISNFCILIEKLVNVAEQMVLHKDIPLLKSLASILNISESELLSFKSIQPKDLEKKYITHKPLLKNILKSLFKTDTDNIKYFLKQLRRINEHKDPKGPKGSLNSLSSTMSKSSSRKNTL